MSLSLSRRHILAGILLLGSVLPVLGEPMSVERALVARDWPALLDALGAAERGEAAWRTFLRGHAALALNRNDESVRHFLSISTPAAIREWDAWTAKHAERHAESSSAWYLRGDALARREAWDDATAAFARALKLEESNGLAWNARGVVHALRGRWKEAGDDFAAAIARQPELADPYANTGIAYVLQSIGRSETVSRTFGEAHRRSPQFRLAKVGEASLRFGIGEWDVAMASLVAEAGAKDAIGGVAATNLAVMRFVQREATSQRNDGDTVAGTSVTVRAGSDFASKQNALNVEILANDVGSIVPREFAAWRNEGVKFLRNVSEASKLPGISEKANPVPIITKAIEWGIRLGTLGNERAASRMEARAAQASNEYRTNEISQIINNHTRYPESAGPRNALSNLLNSPHAAQTRDIAVRSGLPQKQIDALMLNSPKAGGAILSFQRAYTSRGAWGMYVPFGLVYTGISVRDGLQGGGNGLEGVPRR